VLIETPPKAQSETGQPWRLEGASSLAVLIAGMHRSGTSAVSGMLTKLGVAAPEDLLPADEHNERGYFEAKRIVDFHDRLLERLGSPWNDPLRFTYDWVGSPLGQAAAQELAGMLDGEFGDNPMCLFKDPRICRLMPVWSAALAQSGRAAVAILPYRDPLEVAGSLAAREGIARASSLFMWLQHVLLAERFTRDMTRSFASYDDLMADWRAVSAKLQRELRVSWPRDLVRAAPDVDAFLGGELRHQHASPLDAQDALDGLCARTCAGLLRFDADPYDAEAMAAFDAIWAEFDAGFGVFAPLVVEHQRAIAALSAERETLSHDRFSLSQQLDNALAAHEVAVGRVAERDAVIRRRDEVIRERDRQIVGLGDMVHDRDRELAAAGSQIAGMQWELAARDREIDRLRQIEASTFWAVSYPLRRALERFPWVRGLGRGALKLVWWTVTFKLFRKLRASGNTPPAPLPPVASTAGAPAPAPAAASVSAPTATVPGNGRRDRIGNPHILFVSGEAHTPGHHYRVVRLAQAAARGGASASVVTVEELAARRYEVARADLVFIWRATWTDELGALIAAGRDGGAPIVFDIDDLAFDPSLARVEIIDGIRSQGFSEEGTADHFRRTREALAHADVCTAPTQFLGDRIRECGKPAFLLPNTFDEEVLQRSRLAVRRRRAAAADGLVRIGYATGSKTHQVDFAQCADAVAEVLRAHPNARLVLFGWGENPAETQVLKISEFPAFDGLEGQIEWRRMVPLPELPDELARFDICIAPLETGNVFCEAKSELKYFEAALVDVPTVASPTEPYRRAIRHGETGFLAADREAWREALGRLVEDADLRRDMAAAALRDALESFGPERCADSFFALVEQLLGDARRGGRAFELDLLRRERRSGPAPHVPDHEIVFERDDLRAAEVTVVVPLHNYAHVVEEALESVREQTAPDLDLVVIDDASSDDSFAVARRWLEQNADRFNRVLLIRNAKNAGLGFTRNVGFANAETPFVLPLDADNRLRPECVERTLAEIKRSCAAFAYPGIQEFEESADEANTQSWLAERLVAGNFIDAMALVRRSAWAVAGGYDHVRHGWEDYDLWCRLVERGMFGVRVPELLAEYRVHGRSMLRTQTNLLQNKLDLIADMERRHPWLRLNRPLEAGESGA
jgi:hypothetical protein